MSDLIKVDDETSALLTTQDDKDFASLAKNLGFLPSFKLFNAQAKACQQRKITAGNFGLVKSKDDIVDLGPQTDVIPITHRLKAVEKAGDQYLSYYQRSSEGFERAKAKADADKNSGCMAGVEFLLWIPDHMTFALFYAFNTSNLAVADAIKALYLKATTFKSKFVETKKFSWFAPEVLICSTELITPEQDLLNSTVKAFRSPKEATVEVDDDASGRAT